VPARPADVIGLIPTDDLIIDTQDDLPEQVLEQLITFVQETFEALVDLISKLLDQMCHKL